GPPMPQVTVPRKVPFDRPIRVCQPRKMQSNTEALRRKRRGGAPAVEIAHGEAIIAQGGEDVWNWSSPAGRVRLQNRIDLFVDRLGLLGARKRVLELGCGTGLYTERMASSCGSLVAADISGALLDEARRKLGNGRITFVQQDLERIEP